MVPTPFTDLGRAPTQTTHAKLVFTDQLSVGGAIRIHSGLDELAFEAKGDEVFVHTNIYPPCPNLPFLLPWLIS